MNESQRADWLRSLLSKFPAFNIEWSDAVKAKWFECLGRLMRLESSSEKA